MAIRLRYIKNKITQLINYLLKLKNNLVHFMIDSIHTFRINQKRNQKQSIKQNKEKRITKRQDQSQEQPYLSLTYYADSNYFFQGNLLFCLV